MKNNDNVVVIGGSVAGLISAQILSKYFKRVIVIEKDKIVSGLEMRKSTPQAIHPHILLAKGTRILSSIFPNFINAVVEAGAVPVDISKDSLFFVGGDWQPRFKSDLNCYLCSRILLESVIRKQILENKNVHFVDGATVEKIIPDAKKTLVTGVNIKRIGSDESTHEEVIDGDLIVDASGKNSKTPEWLYGLGFDTPEETHVDSNIGYASQYYQIPESFGTQTRLVLVFNNPPYQPKMGGIISVEDNKWLVGLYSIGKDLPSTKPDEFLEFARNLAHPKVYDIIKNAKPISQIYGYRIKGSRLVHYENLDSWPKNYIVIGDAVCTFNPFYGQGMTVAALGAQVLDKCLKIYFNEIGDEKNFAKFFQKELFKTNSHPWILATGEDLRWPTTKGKKPRLLIRLVQKYVDSVFLTTPHSKLATKYFQEMIHMIRSPSFLFHPVIFVKVLWKSIFRR